MQALPDVDFTSTQKSKLITIIAQAEGNCTTAEDIAEEANTLKEVLFIFHFCQRLVDGDIKNKDTSLNDTVTAINANCTTLILLLHDEDIGLPESDDNEVRTANDQTVLYCTHVNKLKIRQANLKTHF